MNKKDVFKNQSQLDWAEYNPKNMKPPMIWRRMNHHGHRFYFGEKDGEVLIACGITTAIDKSFGEPKALRDWKDARPNWKEILPIMADYGTLNHIGLGHLCKEGVIPKYIIEIADETFNKKEQFKKDMLSIKKFFNENEVEVYFLEGILGTHYPTPYGKAWICSAIDMFCKITLTTVKKELVEDGIYERGGTKNNKGDIKYKEVKTETRESFWAIIDLKSNYEHKEEKSFFDSHRYQLIFGRKLISEYFNIPQQEIRMFNLSPLGWTKEPKYALKEHFDKENKWGFTDQQRLEARLNLAVMEGLVTPSGELMEISENIGLDSEYDYRVVRYEDKAREVLNEM
jgi:hypothetical protein